jgi:8-oxo-dGTP diphosphatase
VKTLLVVAIALMNVKGEVLLAQRPEGKRLAGKWEFPGGKVEKHESPEEALIREIKEELDIEIATKDCEPFWFLSHDYVSEFDFHLLMPVYVCRKWQGTPRAVEHAAVKWCHPREMHKMDMIEADAELVEKLIAQHG